MKRGASAVWKKGLKDGSGTMSVNSGAFRDLAYSFTTRFEGTPGTNPEELIAAAEAACFSMAFSAELGKAGITPESVETKATADFDKMEAGWGIKSIHLETTAKVPGADKAKVQEAAEAARKGCPIARLLNTQITLDLKIA
ncbi:MAG TPA: OsmC family peroxiredoxin [Thermoplasmata archaeon]|jgi:osmotically inducible protein OsmC|nr:OsmC family peroxiredoxin [Thermoplasmata archaeon]